MSNIDENSTIKVLIYSEFLSDKPDEGIAKTAYNIYKAFKNLGIKTLAVCREGGGNDIVVIPSNRLLLSYKLRNIIKGFKPTILLYIPKPGATFYSFLRSKLLKLYDRKCKVVFFPLQHRVLSRFHKLLIKLFAKPDYVISTSRYVVGLAKSLGLSTSQICLGVDLNKFKPISYEQKIRLRNRHGFSEKDYIVLHVGHLSKHRNLEVMAKLAKRGAKSIIIASSSSHKDLELKEYLLKSGVMVFDHFIERIEEFYQLADCYVFPVQPGSESGISIPLSILEAMACNLKIVSTPFKDLPLFFKEEMGFFYANPEHLVDKVLEVKDYRHVDTRRLIEKLRWETVCEQILKIVL